MTTVSNEVLVNQIKARIFELKEKLKTTTNRQDRGSIQNAIANNCGWLIEMGVSLDIPELKEA